MTALGNNWAFIFGINRVKFMSAICVILMLMNAVVGIIYVYPSMNEKATQKESLRKVRIQIVQLMRQKQMAEIFNKSIMEVKTLEERLSKKNNQSEMIKSIISLAAASKIKVISNNYEEGKALRDFVPLYQEIKLEGNYKQIKKFIAGVDHMPTLTTVVETYIETTHSAGKLKATLVLETQRKK